jgi:hypothetical protein
MDVLFSTTDHGCSAISRRGAKQWRWRASTTSPV